MAMVSCIVLAVHTYSLPHRVGGGPVALHPLSSGALRIVQWKPVIACPERPVPQRPGSGDSQEARQLDSWLSWTWLCGLLFFTPARLPAAGCPLKPQGHSLASSPASPPPWWPICLPPRPHRPRAASAAVSSPQRLAAGSWLELGRGREAGPEGGRGNFLFEGVFRVPLG